MCSSDLVPKFIKAALNGDELIVHGNGEQTRSFTWVHDVIEYFYLLANKKLYGEIFNIGQTEEISIDNLAKLVIELTESNSKITYVPHERVYGSK